MTKDRIAIVADWLEEQGFTTEQIGNVKEALQSPPAWLPLALVSGITVEVDGHGWSATIIGMEEGRMPPAIRHAFEQGGVLQLGLRRKR
jgi:hypothetical protein